MCRRQVNLMFLKYSDLFCLFVAFPPLGNFHSYWDVIMTVVSLQMTCSRHSWPLNSGGFSNIYYKGHSLIWPSPRTHDTHAHYLFKRLKCVAAVIRTPNLPLAKRTSWTNMTPWLLICNMFLFVNDNGNKHVYIV